MPERVNPSSYFMEGEREDPAPSGELAQGNECDKSQGARTVAVALARSAGGGAGCVEGRARC